MLFQPIGTSSCFIMYNFGLMNIRDIADEMDRLVKNKGWYEPGSKRPQTPKNMAVSLCIEAAEVLECFQWDDDAPDTGVLAAELADVMLYLLQLARLSNIDLQKAVLEKIEVNHHRSWDQDKKENHDKTN